MAERLSRVKHKIMVLSGKGGVGKSTVAVNMAVALALEGRNVGLLDVDFHGPSIPTLLHLEDRQLQFSEKDVIPVAYTENLRVVSLGFLLRKPDEAVIWRGPMKMGVIKQLLTDVQWGNLDYLVIDFPPGTGDEPLSVAQLIPDADGAVIVTTPQDLSLRDVRKSINFCKTLHVPVLGVIENMSGLVCPTCKTVIDVFKRGGGEKMARDMGVPFLGRIPMDPSIVESADSGRPFVDDHGESEAASAFRRAVAPLLALETQRSVSLKQKSGKEESMQTVKIALPVAGGRVCAHFGHCETFALLEVDRGNRLFSTEKTSRRLPMNRVSFRNGFMRRARTSSLPAAWDPGQKSCLRRTGSRSLSACRPIPPKRLSRPSWTADCPPARMFAITDLILGETWSKTPKTGKSRQRGRPVT